MLCFAVLFSFALFEPVSFAQTSKPAGENFARENLVAWCIVPFDDRDRTPEERAQMLGRLGISKYAYDYRAQHIPSFDAEMQAIKSHGIELTAWWFPKTLNQEAKTILDVLRRHKVKTQLWVTGSGDPTRSPEEQKARVTAEADRIRPIALAAAEIGCDVGLYNHGGWFGEPENQIEIIKQLDLPNVGIVYNQHHGHDHIDRFPELLKAMKPYLYAINLNGMVRVGDVPEQKIVPLGQGEYDLQLLKTIRDSGYSGPIGILNHTQQDAELRLLDNLEGLEWLLSQIDGNESRPKPRPRTWTPPTTVEEANCMAPQGEENRNGDLVAATVPPYSAELVAEILATSRQVGDARRGVVVFSSAKSACLNCHRVGRHGGSVGPELSEVGQKQKPEKIVEAIFWPKREVKPEFAAHTVITTDGRVLRGYRLEQGGAHLVLRDPTNDVVHRLNMDEVEAQEETGTLMPDGLTSGMSPQDQADLVRFVLDLGKAEVVSSESIDELLTHAHAHLQGPVDFPFDRAPIHPERCPSWQVGVNRDRVYDYYTKEAEYFRNLPSSPPLLPEFPGLDGGSYGHWGNQNDEVWSDGRWNDTDLGTLQSGVFAGAGVTVARGVCVRLGDHGELSACFNPDTLTYDAVWKGGFLTFSSKRHGFVNSLTLDGTPLARSRQKKPTEPFVYRGFYRHGDRVAFAFRIGEIEYLDAPWVKDGELHRTVAPIASHPLAYLAEPGPPQWPLEFETKIELGDESTYANDTIHLPFENPWNALLFCGDHAFHADGSAYVCTMQGDVWRVTGYEHPSRRATWKRFATGLQHALGMVIDDEGIFVLGRNQITRLHDANGDGEADFYECFSNAYETSSAGHDFICGLERDYEGNFYTASGNQGVVRVSPDGRSAEVVATGFRNPDGINVTPEDLITVPCSEGDWTPSSMICAFRIDGGSSESARTPFFGYRGPKTEGQIPDLPMVYLPRGLDNSSGGQTYVASDRWGPLEGQMLHFSFGTGSHFLLLRDEVEGQLQGAVVPLPGEFRSGAHRGRFSPHDGQLYVSGMAGWGSYTPDDGCFQRIRYTGRAVQVPIGFHVHQNGVLLRFSSPLEEEVAANPRSHFAQCWNYRYGPGYGSPELSSRHPFTVGHDPLAISAAHLLSDGVSLFLEMPELQPVNQLHLRVRPDAEHPVDLFATVHRLDAPFEDFPGYRPVAKTIAPHPILADLALATKRVKNPWTSRLVPARKILIECGGNLSFATRSVHVTAGEPISFTLVNPDVVPHNWALVKPGALERVGQMANRLVVDPNAYARHYIPESSDVLVHTDIVLPRETFTIYFRAPDEPGRYPYLCTFPGHWMVMNGEMIVEAAESR